ncbi:VOC family protein [Aeromicrobium panaciterrae]|uniref:VOC family protein n=1 Tax=Aeromicrobium panaciterrae TaxID=363861 RepID=UPI0031D53896
MALVTYKAVCIDALDAAKMGEFWARTLDYDLETLGDGDAVIRGPGEGEEIWINTVSEPKTVWHRVHLDLRQGSLQPFSELEQVSKTGEFAWTTFRDPEGGEFCVFVHDEPIKHRLKDVVVQAIDPTAISRWWADVMGGDLNHVDPDYSHIDDVPGSSLESFDFVVTTKPKTVKNRVHWDVTLNQGVTVDGLVAKGATVLRAPDHQIRWTVMADPEGNEFCVFDR